MGDSVTTWTDIDSNDLLPGEPFTSAKALAFRDRPVAMAEGSSGAPTVEVAWHEVETVTLGSDGTTVAFTTDVSAYRALRIRGGSKITSPGGTFYIELQIASTFRTAVSHVLTNNAVTFDVEIDNVDGDGGSPKKITLLRLADFNIASGDWDAASFSAVQASVLGFSHYSTAADLVRVRVNGGSWDVSEGGTSFTLLGIKRTQP